MMETHAQAPVARAIAAIAHRGQVDKNGQPYVTHPARVAARLASDRHIAAAWLHDVLEDTDVSAADLREAGIEEAVVRVVQLLTRRPEIDDDEYYGRIAADPDARAVKLADISDNLDPARTTLLDVAVAERLRVKYAHALDALDADASSLTAL